MGLMAGVPRANDCSRANGEGQGAVDQDRRVRGSPRERKLLREGRDCHGHKRSGAQQTAGPERRAGPRRRRLLWAELIRWGFARRALGALGERGVSGPPCLMWSLSREPERKLPWTFRQGGWPGVERGRGKGRREQHGPVCDEVWASGPRVYQLGPWSPIPERGARGVGQVCREFIWEYGAEVAARALRGRGWAGCTDLGSRAGEGNKERK